jgi:hypothetical protein
MFAASGAFALPTKKLLAKTETNRKNAKPKAE